MESYCNLIYNIDKLHMVDCFWTLNKFTKFIIISYSRAYIHQGETISYTMKPSGPCFSFNCSFPLLTSSNMINNESRQNWKSAVQKYLMSHMSISLEWGWVELAKRKGLATSCENYGAFPWDEIKTEINLLPKMKCHVRNSKYQKSLEVWRIIAS